MKKIFSFIKRRKWWLIAALVIIIIVIVRSGGKTGPQTIAVERGDVVSEVSVTGQVKPAQNIDLAFEKSGRISQVSVELGQKVSTGQRLVSIENADLYAQLAQAQAQLDQLKNGARPEELAAKQAELATAQETLASYYRNTINTINDAYAKSDDAVRKQLDDIFNNDESNPQLAFSSNDSQAETDAIFKRIHVSGVLNTWKNELSTLSITSSNETIFSELLTAQQDVAKIRDLLNTIGKVIDAAQGVSTTTLSGYQSALNIARTNVNTAATALSTQQQNISTQHLTVDRVQNEFYITQQGATTQTIAAQQAQVDYYASQVAKTILRAPFSGTITKIAYKTGEIVTPNESVISVVGAGAYEIETNITESDIAKIKVGDSANVTLDAYGSNVFFDATVGSINISETIIEGVATYKTVLQFSKEDERILPGLTANVDILSGKAENVLFVPTRNIQTDNGHYFVNIVDTNDQTNKIEIEIGLKGSDGRTQVLSGLSEGQKILAQ